MIQIGDFHSLEINRERPQGWYLTIPGEDEENSPAVLLPNKYCDESKQIGDIIKVFVYLDSQERPVATTLEPAMALHQFGTVTVKSVTGFGIFCDWGVEKDLFIPNGELTTPANVDDTLVAFLYLDEETGRLVGSNKIENIIDNEEVDIKTGDEVNLRIYRRTQLGLMAIINDRNIGLLYDTEVFSKVNIGDNTKGFVKKIRDDNKIDLTLQIQGHKIIEPSAETILQKLKQANGFLPYHDKSDPKAIADAFAMSKKTFKKAIGSLFKQRVITIKSDGIHLNG